MRLQKGKKWALEFRKKALWLKGFYFDHIPPFRGSGKVKISDVCPALTVIRVVP